MPIERIVAALYRVSTEKQKRDEDLDYQRSQVQFCVDYFRREHDIMLKVGRIFRLVDISGLDVSDADEYKQLRQYVAQQSVAGLIIPAIDRLARTTDYETVAELTKPFKTILGGENQKRIWSFKSEYDITKGEHRVRLFAALEKAENEREMTKWRTSTQKDVLRYKDYSKVDKTPHWIGWDVIGKKGKVLMHRFYYKDGWKKKIADAAQRLLNDDSLADIASDLDYESVNGVREALRSEWCIGYKSRTKKRNERKWDKQKQRYKVGGRFDHETPIRVKVIDDPAMTEETWRAVLAKLAENSDRHRRRRKQSKNFMASSILHCGVCGEPMYHKLQDGRNHAGYFWCASKAKEYRKPKTDRKPDCGIGLIRADTIEDAINLAIIAYLTDPDYIKARLDAMSNDEVTAEKQAKIGRMEQDVESLEGEKSRILTAWRKGLASEDDFASDIKEINEKLASLVMKIRITKDDITRTMSKETRDQKAQSLAWHFADFAAWDQEKKIEELHRHVKKIVVERSPGMEDDIRLHFEMKPGVLDMQYQPDADDLPKAHKPIKKVEGPTQPIRVMRGGTIGGGRSLVDEVEKQRSKVKRQPRPSS